MPEMWEIVAVVAVLLGATLMRTTFGFGDGLLAMPLLSMIAGVRVASPVVALVAITISLLVLIDCWRDFRFANVWRLTVAGLLGIPLGLFFLKGADERILQVALAAVILVFAMHRFWQPESLKLTSDRPAWAFGFVSGVLGGAYNTSGPPIVIFGSLRGWSRDRFRATLQAYFLTLSTCVAAGHGATGLWNAKVFTFYVASLPAVAIAFFVGTRLSRRIPEGKFDRWVSALLAAIGLMFLIRALTGGAG